MASVGMIRINPLSVAKGHRHTCELCSRPATLLCSACRVTYYCSVSHQQTDGAGIHTKICSLLGALRSLRPTLGSEEERQKRSLTIAMSQHALIELCQHEAHKWAIKGRYDLCIPGALQALRFSLDVFGRSRLELVPAYLLLAEGNLGLGRLKAAEEFLLHANWAVLQSTTPAPPSTQSLLHRQFGALYSAQGRWDAARAAYAKDVYHSSLEYGPEHIDTAVGLYHLGAAFLSSQPPNTEAGLAFFDKVVDTWYRFLLHLRAHPSEQVADYLLDHQVAASCAHLLHIVRTRWRQLGARHIATAEAVYVLGLLKVAGGWDVDGEWLLARAEAVYEEVLGRDNESTQGIRQAREELGEVRMQRGERMPDWETEVDPSPKAAPHPDPSSSDQPDAAHHEQKEAMQDAEEAPASPPPAEATEVPAGAEAVEEAAPDVDEAAAQPPLSEDAEAAQPTAPTASQESEATATSSSLPEAAVDAAEADPATKPTTAPAEEEAKAEDPAPIVDTEVVAPSEAHPTPTPAAESVTQPADEASPDTAGTAAPAETTVGAEASAAAVEEVAEVKTEALPPVAAVETEAPALPAAVAEEVPVEAGQAQAPVEVVAEVEDSRAAEIAGKAVEEQKEAASEEEQTPSLVSPAVIQPSREE